MSASARPIRSRTFRAASFAILSMAIAALATAALLSGCNAIEHGSDSLADATAGSGISSIFRGAARMAEGMREYSPSEEHFIGRAVAAEILSRYPVHDDARLTEYVNLVGLSVVYASPAVRQTFSGYHFTILEGDELNAVSAPGGFVFLTLGAVKRARNEDELAAVLAHEISHVTLRHGIKAIKAATQKQSFALLAQGAGQTATEVSKSSGSKNAGGVEIAGVFANAITDITGDLLVHGYGRKAELAADELAIEFLKASGHSRGGLASYLDRVGAEAGKGGWTSTHPAPADRVKALGKKSQDENDNPKVGFADREKRFLAAVGA